MLYPLGKPDLPNRGGFGNHGNHGGFGDHGNLDGFGNHNG